MSAAAVCSYKKKSDGLWRTTDRRFLLSLLHRDNVCILRLFFQTGRVNRLCNCLQKYKMVKNVLLFVCLKNLSHRFLY